jgi:hypothetical protein
MKIVIYVDYSNNQFNKDFELSNKLISSGHNVFLAINDNQFEELKKNCDKAVLGHSVNNIDKYSGVYQFANLTDIEIDELFSQ